MSPSGPSAKRLLQELKHASKEGLGLNVASLCPKNSSDLFQWTAVLQGPAESPYAGGLFSMDIQVPSEYPLAPPLIKFTTPICHPNIHWKVVPFACDARGILFTRHVDGGDLFGCSQIRCLDSSLDSSLSLSSHSPTPRGTLSLLHFF